MKNQPILTMKKLILEWANDYNIKKERIFNLFLLLSKKWR